MSGNKLLLNCRAGIGRAGSVAVAYVYYTNPEMSYDDAYNYCSKKRFVYPHSRLRERIEQVFPRYFALKYFVSSFSGLIFSCHGICNTQLLSSLYKLFFQKTQIRTFTPEIPSWIYMFMLEAMTYKAALRIPNHLNIDAQRLEVFAWTNQVDRHQSNGQCIASN